MVLITNKHIVTPQAIIAAIKGAKNKTGNNYLVLRRRWIKTDKRRDQNPPVFPPVFIIKIVKYSNIS